MDTTNTAPLTAPASTPSTGTTPRDLDSLSVRELICELAATEALLRQRPSDVAGGSTVRLQALIVGELHRRGRGPGGDNQAPRPSDAIADGGALARE